MQSDAESFLETDENLTPTGKITPVDNTAFDFREPKKIGHDFDLSYEPMRLAGGYDHCLVFPKSDAPMAEPRATVWEEKRGVTMELYTDMPSVHFYTGNYLIDADHPFKGGCQQHRQMAFCLETEKMPDSINHEGFTDTTLDVGEVYESTTVFKFSVK